MNNLYERSTRALRRSLHLYDDGVWRVNSIVQGWMREWNRLDAAMRQRLEDMGYLA